MVIDERDLCQEEKWYYEKQCKRVVNSLIKNNVDAKYAPGREEALAMVKELIPKNASIGIGDSVTLHEIGLFTWLESQPNKVIFNAFIRTPDGHNRYSPEERFELMRKALISDVFLTGSNAVTLDGKLVNIDARGNRVAGMIFGPRKTILVIGANKIVKDVDEALIRIKRLCSPMNIRRHIVKHHYDFWEKLPCAVRGECIECDSPLKICRKIVIIDGQIKISSFQPSAELEQGLNVIMVGEHLGI